MGKNLINERNMYLNVSSKGFRYNKKMNKLSNIRTTSNSMSSDCCSSSDSERSGFG